ncbi:hypothetical protein A2154_00300 [Candidatus Gottesmanbacteria bacterium RBG_16_43_7]|uniref:EamA domain-containing protein n=1 Tax=Candidatus Gottesmanbacteria bacterium RBG_16_43_7 TaxID=1798373 RepID=A0A1F5Z8K4_9BACT|nr:MAG: hypothetical protein A2154_00300 [Candidatus Gottesmanbacteria bacterium RBG_16_43_7]
MALISGTLAYTLNNKAVRTIEVGEVSVFTYIQPLFTLPLSLYWLNESITPMMIGGIIIATIGVSIAESRRLQTQPASGKHRH